MLDAGVRTGVPATVVDLDDCDVIERAVVEALAYADVFDWPLTSADVHRYLPVTASVDEVQSALASWRRDGIVSSIGDLHFRRGREDLVEERRRREAVSARLWPAARRYGRWIAWLPWVRLVGVSGSLAVGAPTEGADVDLFVVSAERRLWLTRALTIGVVKLAGRSAPPRRVVLCPNYVVTTAALELADHDLFTAHELVQLVPLAGPDTYRALLDQNQWYRGYLPNHPGYVLPIGALRGGRLRAILERGLASRLVGRVERWEMRRKIARFAAQEPSTETRFDDSVCKGHFEGHRRRVMDDFSARVRAITGACR
jgi:hypothetical protein